MTIIFLPALPTFAGNRIGGTFFGGVNQLVNQLIGKFLLFAIFGFGIFFDSTLQKFNAVRGACFGGIKQLINHFFSLIIDSVCIFFDSKFQALEFFGATLQAVDDWFCDRALEIGIVTKIQPVLFAIFLIFSDIDKAAYMSTVVILTVLCLYVAYQFHPDSFDWAMDSEKHIQGFVNLQAALPMKWLDIPVEKYNAAIAYDDPEYPIFERFQPVGPYMKDNENIDIVAVPIGSDANPAIMMRYHLAWAINKCWGAYSNNTIRQFFQPAKPHNMVCLERIVYFCLPIALLIPAFMDRVTKGDAVEVSWFLAAVATLYYVFEHLFIWWKTHHDADMFATEMSDDVTKKGIERRARQSAGEFCAKVTDVQMNEMLDSIMMDGKQMCEEQRKRSGKKATQTCFLSLQRWSLIILLVLITCPYRRHVHWYRSSSSFTAPNNTLDGFERSLESVGRKEKIATSHIKKKDAHYLSNTSEMGLVDRILKSIEESYPPESDYYDAVCKLHLLFNRPVPQVSQLRVQYHRFQKLWTLKKEMKLSPDPSEADIPSYVYAEAALDALIGIGIRMGIVAPPPNPSLLSQATDFVINWI